MFTSYFLLLTSYLKGEMPVPVVAGAVGGGVGFLIIVGLVLLLCWHRRKHRAEWPASSLPYAVGDVRVRLASDNMNTI